MHFLRQKICLMALIESVFKRMGTQRRIPFNTIGQETRLPAHEVRIYSHILILCSWIIYM